MLKSAAKNINIGYPAYEPYQNERAVEKGRYQVQRITFAEHIILTLTVNTLNFPPHIQVCIKSDIPTEHIVRKDILICIVGILPTLSISKKS